MRCSWSVLLRGLFVTGLVGFFLREALGPFLDAVELPRPEALERLGPVVDRFQLLTIDPVKPLPPVLAHGDEADVLQHAQVLRHHRLRPAEPHDDRVDRQLPFRLREELEHAPPLGLGDGVERVEGCRGSCHAVNVFPNGNMSSEKFSTARKGRKKSCIVRRLFGIVSERGCRRFRERHMSKKSENPSSRQQAATPGNNILSGERAIDLFLRSRKELSERQRTAVELLLQGSSDEMVGRQIGVDRTCIYKWRTRNVAFQREMERQRRALWEQSAT